MPLQTFRYAACGGSNTLLDILIFNLSYHYLYKEQFVHTPIVSISPHIAALLTGMAVTFPLGFYLSRNVVFAGSTLRGRVQLARYGLLVSVCIVLNYTFMKLFVDGCHIFPTVAKILTTAIVVTFSYLTQKKFTFKVESSGVVK